MILNKIKFIAIAGCLLIPLLFPKKAIGMDDEDDKRRTVVQNILKTQRGSCIKTSNLFITPFNEPDLEAYENIQKNDSLTPGRHFHTQISPDNLKGYLRAIKDKKHVLSDPTYPFRIYSVYCLDLNKKLNYNLIGFFMLTSLTMEMGLRNVGCSNLNYIIDPAFRNKGFGNEMLNAITANLIPPLLHKTYPVMSSINEVLSNGPPMPFTHVRAYIDLDNIPSQKMALKSGFSPHDLTVDKGKEYQIEFRFPESNKTWISEEDQKLISQLSDPQIKEHFVELCKQRTLTRKTEDDQFSQLFGGLLNSMGPKNLAISLKKAAKK